jgi:hypothetical protein
MNWISSIVGALLVAVAGLGVGFAIGGKKTTRTVTRTTTVAHTVQMTITAKAPPTNVAVASTTTGATSSTTSTTNGSGTPSREYYATYLASQTTGSNASNAGLDDNPQNLELNGQTYPHAVALDLYTDNGSTIESYQLPIPGFNHFSASVAGLQTSDSAKASYKLTIYKNNDDPGATVLYSATFTGPSGTHPVSFATQGATDLVLDWANLTNPEADSEDGFIFANPVVTSS